MDLTTKGIEVKFFSTEIERVKLLRIPQNDGWPDRFSLVIELEDDHENRLNLFLEADQARLLGRKLLAQLNLAPFHETDDDMDQAEANADSDELRGLEDRTYE